jgi:hypothetical protein
MDRRAALDGSRVPANHDFAAKYEAPSKPASVATGSLDRCFTSTSMAEHSSPLGSDIRAIRSESAPPRRKRQPPSTIADARSDAEYGKEEQVSPVDRDIGTECRRHPIGPHEVAELFTPPAMESLGASLARFRFQPPTPDTPVPFQALETAMDACQDRLATLTHHDRSTWTRLKALAEGIAEEQRMAVQLLKASSVVGQPTNTSK